MKIKIITYKKTGKRDDEFFFDNIQDALEKYVGARNSIPNFWRQQSLWPTIWINTENGFVRVHDYPFEELTEGNIAKYLSQRILDTDDLLVTL